MEFPCTFCGKIFHDKTSNSKHEKAVHLNERYECSECDKDFSTKHTMLSHKATHLGTTFQCDYCEHKAITKANLRRHEISNHAEFTRHKVTKYDCAFIFYTF